MEKVTRQLQYVCMATCIVFLAAQWPTAVCWAQETVTITTFYPSPDGIYKVLRLMPRSDIDPFTSSCSNAGALFYHEDDNMVYICDGANWMMATDLIWTLDGNYLHAGDPSPGDPVASGFAIGAGSGSMQTYCLDGATKIYGDSLQVKNVNGDATLRLEAPDRAAFFGPGQWFGDGGRLNLNRCSGCAQAGTIRFWDDGAISHSIHHHHINEFYVYGKFKADNLLNIKQDVQCPDDDTCSVTINFPAGRFTQTPVVTCTAGPSLNPARLPKGTAAVSCSINSKSASGITAFLGTHDPAVSIKGWMTVYIMAVEP